MKALHNAAILISAYNLSSQRLVGAVMVGDEVCTTGYIMDQFCINRGTLLDNSDVITLEQPEQHSFHCLLDVPRCKDSGYVVLTDKNEDTGMHCLGYRLEDTQAVLDAGLAAGKQGYCTDCTGDETKPEYGYKATIKGTVKEMGDGTDGLSGTPVLENIEVLDQSVVCETETVEPVCMEPPPPPEQTDPVPSTVVPPANAGPTQSCPDILDMSEQIDTSATLYYAIVPSNPSGSGNNGLLCARLEVSDHDGWVGFGISEDNFMAGSDAILGDPVQGTVLKYHLPGYSGPVVMSDDKQTLLGASIEQEDGKTIMYFTKLLVESGEISISEEGTNIFLHARGTGSISYHSDKTHFELAFAPSAPSIDLKVGDEVCITNYIMDQFCINRGTFLDNGDIMTLDQPEKHSFHCLLDVPQCKDSGYVVLTDKSEETGMHCLGYRLAETETVVAAGLAAGQKGYCTDCTGDESKPEYGYKATVKGTIRELGDGSSGLSGTPVLENIEVLDHSVQCEATIVSPVCMKPPTPPPTPFAQPLTVGDKVCITSYIMDQFCINRGTFLDNGDIMTLEHPEEHSFHCLLDVPRCRDSGYVALGDKNEETGMHCLGYRLEDTQAVLDAGLAAGRKGYCTDCTGDESKPERGFKATIKGTVKALGDGSDGLSGTPVLENIEVLDDSVVCETTTIPPLCTGGASSPVTEPDVPAKDCTSQFCEKQLAANYLLRYQIIVRSDTNAEVCDGCEISMELIYDGEAWVAIAFSTDGQMIGSEAVIGNPGDGSVLKYFLAAKDNSGVSPMPQDRQTLSKTSVEFKDGQTITRFTKMMKELGEIEITTGDNSFLWAHGTSTTLGYHSARKSFSLNLSSGATESIETPNKAAWLAHGIMAFVAWGVFVPFAVQSSLLRNVLPCLGDAWFQVHRALNASAYVFSIAFFAIAVAYTGKEGGSHFDNSHKAMGLAMFVMSSVQVLGGALRPHLPAPDSNEEKTGVRKGWETTHRVLGVTLLACGFWQMSKGIELYAIKYSVSQTDEKAVTIAYWVSSGVMIALIILGGAFKLRGSGASNNEAAPLADAPDEEDQ